MLLMLISRCKTNMHMYHHSVPSFIWFSINLFYISYTNVHTQTKEKFNIHSEQVKSSSDFVIKSKIKTFYWLFSYIRIIHYTTDLGVDPVGAVSYCHPFICCQGYPRPGHTLQTNPKIRQLKSSNIKIIFYLPI